MRVHTTYTREHLVSTTTMATATVSNPTAAKENNKNKLRKSCSDQDTRNRSDIKTPATTNNINDVHDGSVVHMSRLPIDRHTPPHSPCASSRCQPRSGIRGRT